MLRLFRWLIFGTDEHLGSIKEQFRELSSKVTTLERDFLDLDTRYRKLRGFLAAETRHNPPEAPRSAPTAHPEQPGAILEGKAALRERALATLRQKSNVVG